MKQKTKKEFSESKIRKIEKNLLELEESLSKLDAEYKGVRDMGNLFSLSIDEDYHKPRKIFNGFDNKNNYTEYESKGNKDKNLSPKKYLDMIRPYLSDIVNDHETQEVLRVYSGNKVIDYETTLGELKIQLKMSINFISSKDDSDETRKMHNKGHNVEITMSSETDEVIEELFEFFFAKLSKRFRRINERKWVYLRQC